MSIDNSDQFYKPAGISEIEIREELTKMELNPELNTKASLVKESQSSLRLMTFEEKHLSYLRQHPKVSPLPYLANLKTMIKVRKEK